MALITVEELAALLEAGNQAARDIRLIDVRWYLADLEQGRREYDTAHLPGALFFDVETDLSARAGPGRHPMPDRSELATRLGQTGVGNQHRIVVYDTCDGSIAARLWWMLRDLGHNEVSVLDGGYRAWVNAGYPVSDKPARLDETAFAVGPSTVGQIDRDALLSKLGRVVLLDARAPERYRGEVEPVDPIAGHIPTALSMYHGSNVNADGTFLSPQELRARFESLGAKPGEVIVTYCGSGVTSCHTVLAMHIAGLETPLLYPGSWSDWSTERYPIAVGDEPGSR